MSLLGPQGAMARFQEIQARIDAFSGPASPSSGSAAPKGASARDFQSALIGVSPADPSQFAVTPTSGQLGSMADAAAAKYGLDPKIFRSLVNTESSWNPNAKSPVGASGLTQLMPGTARALGVQDTSDPAQSLEGGAKYLRQMLDQFGGDYSKALAAYNAGPGAVMKAHGIPHYHETVAYVRKILGQAETMA